MMRVAVLACLVLAAIFCFAPDAHAQSRASSQVYHCVGVHGEPVFSGQPCGTPAPPPGTLGGDTQEVRGGSACAASPDALKQAIATAFAGHDVNRLAGLILWRGMGSDDARATLRALDAWLKQPLAGIAAAYPQGPPPAVATSSGAAARAPNAFEVSTGGGSTREFDVVHAGACWWLTF